eukprot:TRINITY_DN13344_c0_g1_i1.p1 TRINITY_DN13344_c0_g1~~TRINITY_DN13344_c0_g1_i1.p1  ORF type:complete len:283 (+),score=36.26 TRINITY_DN13344_c0_g1_i1:82-930(+)
METALEKSRLEIEKIERDHDVKVILAGITGSHAKNLHCETTSDVDLNFVWVHRKLRDYVGFTAKRQSDTIVKESGEVEYKGWEARRACVFVREVNPAIVGLLGSPLIFRSESPWAERFIAAAQLHCTRDKLIHSFAGFVKGIYLGHVSREPEIVLKRYLHVLIPTMVLYWLLEAPESINVGTDSCRFPPQDITVLLNCMQPKCAEVAAAIANMVGRKKCGSGAALIPAVPCVNEFMLQCYERGYAHRTSAAAAPSEGEVVCGDDVLDAFLEDVISARDRVQL